MTKSYKVVGIGNAIIDIFTYVDDEFLKKNNIKKGVMNLISSDRSKELLKGIKNKTPPLFSNEGRCLPQKGFA